MFSIGYYQQKQDMFTKKANSKTETENKKQGE
jgi:hypothetical protein